MWLHPRRARRTAWPASSSNRLMVPVGAGDQLIKLRADAVLGSLADRVTGCASRDHFPRGTVLGNSRQGQKHQCGDQAGTGKSIHRSLLDNARTQWSRRGKCRLRFAAATDRADSPLQSGTPPRLDIGQSGSVLCRRHPVRAVEPAGGLRHWRAVSAVAQPLERPGHGAVASAYRDRLPGRARFTTSPAIACALHRKGTGTGTTLAAVRQARVPPLRIRCSLEVAHGLHRGL